MVVFCSSIVSDVACRKSGWCTRCKYIQSYLCEYIKSQRSNCIERLWCIPFNTKLLLTYVNMNISIRLAVHGKYTEHNLVIVSVLYPQPQANLFPLPLLFFSFLNAESTLNLISFRFNKILCILIYLCIQFKLMFVTDNERC